MIADIGPVPDFPAFNTLNTTLSHNNQLLTLSLNRPQVVNAFNQELVMELHQVLDMLAPANSPVRVVILRGNGRMFCAGADFTSVNDVDGWKRASQLTTQNRSSEIILKIRRAPQIFIGAAHGAASGAGMMLFLACDCRICTADIKMNAGFIRLGLSGGEMGSSFLLPRAVGSSVASELLLTGRFMNGQRALQTGLVSEIGASQAEIDHLAVQMAEDMLQTTRIGLRTTKQSLNAADCLSLDAIVAFEDRQQIVCFKEDEVFHHAVQYMTNIQSKTKTSSISKL